MSRSADLGDHLEQLRRARERVPSVRRDDPAPANGGPRRGHRLIGWVEWVVEPVRDRLTRSDYDDLVSSLALVIGWEAFIGLLDVRGLSVSPDRAP